MPLPVSLRGNVEKANQLKQIIYSRVVEIWGDNTNDKYEPEALLKVAQCAAEDEIYFSEGIEAEQIELVMLEVRDQQSYFKNDS